MVRKYERTTTHQSWSEESMRGAIMDIVNKVMSYEKAARNYNISKATLYRRVQMFEKTGQMKTTLKKGHFKPVFNESAEAELVKYLLYMQSRLHGLTPKEFRSLAYELAEKNNIQHPFRNERAGKAWLQKFMHRSGVLSLRKPQPTSAARAQRFSRENVTEFFELYQEVLTNLNLTADRIWNVDEVGILTVPKQYPKIIARKGQKQVGTLASGEKGQLVTAEMCISAREDYMPPIFVYPGQGKPVPENYTFGAPENSTFVQTPNGWIHKDTFFIWFQKFVTFSGAKKEQPVLLICDGHASHKYNLLLLEYAIAHGVYIICLPPHCTHRMQPLDVACMRVFQMAYTRRVAAWLRTNAPKVVTHQQIAELFGEASRETAVPSHAISGFRKTGTFPFNPHVFSDEDFVASTASASEPTDQQRDDENDDNILDSVASSHPRLGHRTLLNDDDARLNSPQPGCLTWSDDCNFNDSSPRNFSRESAGATSSTFDEDHDSPIQSKSRRRIFYCLSSSDDEDPTESLSQNFTHLSVEETDIINTHNSSPSQKYPEGSVDSDIIEVCIEDSQLNTAHVRHSAMISNETTQIARKRSIQPNVQEIGAKKKKVSYSSELAVSNVSSEIQTQSSELVSNNKSPPKQFNTDFQNRMNPRKIPPTPRRISERGHDSFITTPQSLMPIGQVKVTSSRRGRKPGRAEVLTKPSYVETLKSSMEKEKEKSELKRLRGRPRKNLCNKENEPKKPRGRPKGSTKKVK